MRELGLVEPHVGIAVLWPASGSIVWPEAVDCETVPGSWVVWDNW